MAHDEHDREGGRSEMSERQASTFRQGSFTSAHVQALNILGLNHVAFLAEEPVHIYGQFDFKGRPLAYKVDILINDANYGAGVVEIDGEIHKKLTREWKDLARDSRLQTQGLWVEHIPNEEVAGIMDVLERHRVKIDSYGGRS